MQQRIVLAIAILAGILAFGLTHRYLKNERERITAGYKKVLVLAAKKDLPAGTVLETGDLVAKEIFETAVSKSMVFYFKREDGESDVNRIVGKKTRMPLRRGEPVWATHVDIPLMFDNSLANAVVDGRRALSIPVSGEAAVSGLIRPGDRVDILGTFVLPSRKTPGETENVTLTVLQDVTLLATGNKTDASDIGVRGGAGGFNAVTLEVTSAEAELLVFAQSMKGRLYLTLRNKSDATYLKELPEVTFEEVEKRIPELNAYRQRVIRGKTGL